MGNGTQQNRLQEQQARTLAHIKLRLDPWQADFGPEFTGFDEASPEVSEKVDIEIETPLTKWGALDPSPGPVPEPVWFIDGVRRIEARVTVETDGHYTYGGFGAYAVGAVRLTAEKKEAEDRLKDYNDRITLVGSTDPDAERKQIDKRIKSLEEGRNDAAVESKRAEKTAAECTLKLATAKTVLDGAEDQLADAISMVDSALIREGFPSIADAISAVMKAADVESGAESIRTFDTRCIELSARLLELDGQLMGVFLDENDVLRADRELQERAQNLDNLKTEASVLEDRVKTLRANTARAEELRARLAKDSAEHAIFKELALDLKSDRFQRYLFDGAFRKLVVGASTRLRQFSDRYELSYSGGQFGVIDNDHGGQTRMADTLSGGETFLASLALALELSDQIQESAGAVRLDSLFIDEGFGTLDPETLETVAEAIETLGRTNRLVGVITHVPELHRRLPRLEVKPSPLGSSVIFMED